MTWFLPGWGRWPWAIVALCYPLTAADWYGWLPDYSTVGHVLSAATELVFADDRIETFQPVDCLACGGPLKPDVVFFGENVPRPRVDECFALTERAALLLVLGSSLTVLSGYRFVRHAARCGVPVAIVNQGPTRGDAHALLTLDAPLGPALTTILAAAAA